MAMNLTPLPVLPHAISVSITEHGWFAKAFQTLFDQAIAPGNDTNARVSARVIGLHAQKQILFESSAGSDSRLRFPNRR